MDKKALVYIGIASSIFLGGIGVLTNHVYANQSQAELQSEQEASSIQSEEAAKEEVHFKMLNSIDYYNNAKIKAKIHYANAGVETTVEAEVDFNLPASRGIYLDKYDNGEIKKIEAYYLGADNEFLDIYHDSKEYRGGFIPESTTKAEEKEYFFSEYPTLQSRYFEDEEGIPCYVFREDVSLMGQAADILFPQSMALGYLEDYQSWDISGEEELLNRDTVVLDGSFNNYFSNKYSAETFKMWVDKETGILLKYESYTDEGEVRDYIYTDDIQIDQPISRSTFTIPAPPKEYESLEIPMQ